jgi:hypothetical protein
LGFLLLLPLTIGWKLTLRPDDPYEPKDAIVEFLTQQHFSVVVTSEVINDMFVIGARSDQCRLLVAKGLPLRNSTDQVQYIATPNDHTFIVFRGIIYDKQPILLTVGSYLWFRVLGAFGLGAHIPLVLAVVSSCDAERAEQLPWSVLRSI